MVHLIWIYNIDFCFQDRKETIPEEAEAQQLRDALTLSEVSEEIPKVAVTDIEAEKEKAGHSSKQSSSDERDAT